MLSVTRSGSITGGDAAVQLRALVQDAVPLVVAKALTFTAQKAQQAIVAEMPRVFDRGATRYTLNSTRIETATADRLAARVAVKDRASNTGTLPEDYLFPQVFGGPRKEKRFERSLRYAGALAPNLRAVLGRDTPPELVDAFGNLKRGEIQRILTATRTAFDRAARKTDSARSRRNARNAPYFIGGLPTGVFRGGQFVQKPGAMQPGIYRRQGTGRDAKIIPVLVFVAKQPRYRQRLDFEGIARATAEQQFEPTFRRLLAAARKG